MSWYKKSIVCNVVFLYCFSLDSFSKCVSCTSHLQGTMLDTNKYYSMRHIPYLPEVHTNVCKIMWKNIHDCQKEDCIERRVILQLVVILCDLNETNGEISSKKILFLLRSPVMFPYVTTSLFLWEGIYSRPKVEKRSIRCKKFS